MERTKNSNNKDAVKVFFDLKNTGWKWAEESLWALPVSSTNIFKLDNIPLLAYGISRGDTFQAKLSESGVYHFEKAIERSGHSTVRVHFRMHPLDLDTVKKYLDKFNQLGCSYEGNGATLYAIDIPAGSRLNDVLSFLKETEQLGIWDYEEGYIHKD